MVLFVLAYIHSTFSRTPINCLADYQEVWPRNGILGVEIVHNRTSPQAFSIYNKKGQAGSQTSTSTGTIGGVGWDLGGEGEGGVCGGGGKGACSIKVDYIICRHEKIYSSKLLQSR